MLRKMTRFCLNGKVQKISFSKHKNSLPISHSYQNTQNLPIFLNWNNKQNNATQLRNGSKNSLEMIFQFGYLFFFIITSMIFRVPFDCVTAIFSSKTCLGLKGRQCWFLWVTAFRWKKICLNQFCGWSSSNTFWICRCKREEKKSKVGT